MNFFFILNTPFLRSPFFFLSLSSSFFFLLAYFYSRRLPNPICFSSEKHPLPYWILSALCRWWKATDCAENHKQKVSLTKLKNKFLLLLSSRERFVVKALKWICIGTLKESMFQQWEDSAFHYCNVQSTITMKDWHSLSQLSQLINSPLLSSSPQASHLMTKFKKRIFLL